MYSRSRLLESPKNDKDGIAEVETVIAMTYTASSGNPQSQLDKFKEAARCLEADDDAERFKAAREAGEA